MIGRVWRGYTVSPHDDEQPTDPRGTAGARPARPRRCRDRDARGADGDRAPRGADLHPGQGRRARAPRHVPVPLRRLLAEDQGDGGPAARARPDGRALAQGAAADRGAGDAPPGARPEPARRGRRRATPGTPQPAAAAVRLPGRGRDRAGAVRRGGAPPLRLPRASGGDADGRRGGLRRDGQGSAPAARPRRRRTRSGRTCRTSPPSGTCTARSRPGWPGWRSGIGEERLFIGPARAQATEEHFRWEELVAVHDMASARRRSRRSWSRARGRAATGRTRTSAAWCACSTSSPSSAPRTRPSSRRDR